MNGKASAAAYLFQIVLRLDGMVPAAGRRRRRAGAQAGRGRAPRHRPPARPRRARRETLGAVALQRRTSEPNETLPCTFLFSFVQVS